MNEHSEATLLEYTTTRESPRQVLPDEDPSEEDETEAKIIAKQNEALEIQAKETNANLLKRIEVIRAELAALYKAGQNTSETIIPLEDELTTLLAQQSQVTAETKDLQPVSLSKGLFTNDPIYKFLKEGLNEIRNGFKEVRADIKAGNTLRAMQKEHGLTVTSRWNMFWKMKPSDIRSQIVSINNQTTQAPNTPTPKTSPTP